MRILLDVTSAAKARPTGIANYARELVAALVATADTHELRTATRMGRWRTRHFARDIRGSDGRAPRLLMGAGYGIGGGAPDLLHALGVRLPPRGRFLKVVTIHDLGTLDRPDFTPQDWSRRRGDRIAESVARADAIITPSEFTRSRLLALFKDLDPQRVRVVWHGVDASQFHPQSATARQAACSALALKRPFVLHVSAYAPRKNQAFLIRAFARAQLGEHAELVFCGPRGEGITALQRVAQADGIEGRVRFLGYLAPAQVPQLLGAARLFAIPSYYEGFGLPLLEAMATGTPVLAARTSSLPEVGGDAARYFDPDDVDGLAQLLSALWTDADARAELGVRAAQRAAAFTWARAARETLAFYEELGRSREA